MRRPAAIPSRSPRWHANMAYGGDQEMIAALRSRGGELWGAIGLYREPDRPLFDEAELGFVRAISPLLAEGVRRSLLVGEAADPEGPDAPGMVVLNGDWELESTSPGVERWLAELPDGGERVTAAGRAAGRGRAGHAAGRRRVGARGGRRSRGC